MKIRVEQRVRACKLRSYVLGTIYIFYVLYRAKMLNLCVSQLTLIVFIKMYPNFIEIGLNSRTT